MPDSLNKKTGVLYMFSFRRRYVAALRRGRDYLVFLLAGFALIYSMSGAEPFPSTFVWDYSNASRMPEGWGGVKMEINLSTKTPDGMRVLEIIPDNNRDDQDWPGHLRYPLRSGLAKGAKEVEISFWIKGDADTMISLRLTSARGTRYTTTQSYDLKGEWQQIEFREAISGAVGGKWLNAPRLLFEKTRRGQHFLIGPVTFKTIN